MSLISVSKDSGKPKYKQIIGSIEEGLVKGRIKKGDKLPSINSIRNRLSISRDTVLMAFNELKNRGIVESISGKGYYVRSVDVNVERKIFLLFDELNAFKEDLYSSFLANLEENVEVEIYFHHFSQDMFRKLIYDSIGNYSYYVIMPANLRNTELIINKLPKERVYILDQTQEELSDYPGIYQNFEKDIYSSLCASSNLLEKYEKIVLLFPEKKQPQGMLRGFNKFRKSSKFPHEIISTLEGRKLAVGEVYLILDDQSLIVLIKKLKDQHLLLGEDVGVISYNDTLLKEIVEGGITTISTDFKQMGKRLAKMISLNERVKIENPNALIVRNSL